MQQEDIILCPGCSNTCNIGIEILLKCICFKYALQCLLYRFQDGSNMLVPDYLWDSGEGKWNCINRNEHCVAIKYNGKLHAHNCDYAYPCICEL